MHGHELGAIHGEDTYSTDFYPILQYSAVQLYPDISGVGVCDNENFIIAIMYLIITIITILDYTRKYQLDSVNVSNKLSLCHSLCSCACFIAISGN